MTKTKIFSTLILATGLTLSACGGGGGGIASVGGGGIGGTGISSRDGTFEIVSELIEKPLEGFGELFRMLSYTDIGPAAMLTRACAGLARRTILVSMPGSEAAVRLAMHKLLLPELGHLVSEARR